jgi:hypothetical protein
VIGGASEAVRSDACGPFATTGDDTAGTLSIKPVVSTGARSFGGSSGAENGTESITEPAWGACGFSRT